MSNLNTWKQQHIVAEYAAATELQPPEKAILDRLGEQLPRMKMLDVGVGGGRTTIHFAAAAEEYWGIDYSEEMIAACRNRFQNGSSSIRFAVCNAKAMNICPDRFFSFILFSFNGIDYVSHEDRLRVFKEVQRVGTTGGLFCFSTHNLQGLHHFEFKAQLTGEIPKTAKNILEWLLLRFYYNKISSLTKLRQAPYALVNDGVHRKGLLTYYIRPSEQLNQLRKCSFENIQFFRLTTGEILDADTEDAIDDPWLYYLCTIR
jgi:ubiquinone/menaquinone biosynthesis C-methylase UbiE